MCRLFETIRVVNRIPAHLDYHNVRMNRARKLLFGLEKPIDLREQITIPENLSNALHKCRVVYQKEILSIEFEPYIPRQVQRLKLVHCDEIDYSFKFTDRKKLNALFEQRGDADDVLIIKNGWVTDTSFANIIFWDGNRWVTPSKPLLKGTARARLLESGTIFEGRISVRELDFFTRARIINAMIGPDEGQDLILI